MEDLALGLAVAGEQAAVELEGPCRDPVAGLDDARHDPPLDRPHEVVLDQLLDVVVEPGLREAELRGELLDGPRRVPALDHRLEDPQPRRIADGTQRLHVADQAHVLGLEVRVESVRVGGRVGGCVPRAIASPSTIQQLLT